MRTLIYLSCFLFLFLSDCLAYDWIPLAFDTEDAINIAVQKEVSKKEDYDSAAFQRSAIIDAQNEVNEKNRAVDQNLIRLRNSYNREKNKRDTQKTLYDDARNRFDKEEVKYKTAIENINKSKSQKEGYKKEISLQQANLTKRLANEPVGEVVTIALYSTGWKEKKSSQEKKADILATESAIEMMMTYIDSSSIVENNILIKDMIISRKSGQAESIKQPLEQKLAAGKYLRIRNFRLYPLKKSLLRSDMDFKKQKVKAVAVLDSEVLKRFINENKIVVSDNFLKRANTLIAESRRTTAEDQKNLNNIITSQMRIISNKKINLQDVIESIKHHEGLKKISHENMNRLSTELKNEKTRLEKQAATFKKTETAYFNAKNAFTHYVFKKPRGQIKRDKAPPEIAAGILISTLHEVRDDSRRYYSDIFEQTNMGMLSAAEKGNEQVSIKITKFKLTYITESATSDDMEIGAIFEVTMGKRNDVEKIGDVSINWTKEVKIDEGIPISLAEASRQGMDIVSLVKKNWWFPALFILIIAGFFIMYRSWQKRIANEPDFTNNIGMKFVLIPAGTFMMGSPSNEPERYSDERQHEVTLTKGFYMGVTEVTQRQWKAVMGNNPSNFKGDNRPVEQVSWNDIHKFIKRLNKKDGTNKYRLPTEAEWEYACRAGTTTPFYTGNCLSTDQANYNGNYPMPGCSKGMYRRKTIDVASFSPNAWGLYDMHGNVWEWCDDRKPEGAFSGATCVLRGGSWISFARGLRSASRWLNNPDGRDYFTGFRVVCCGKPYIFTLLHLLKNGLLAGPQRNFSSFTRSSVGMHTELPKYDFSM